MIICYNVKGGVGGGGHIKILELMWGMAKKERKEGNILFNDTLNTLYLQLYGVRHMVKNHSDS